MVRFEAADLFGCYLPFDVLEQNVVVRDWTVYMKTAESRSSLVYKFESSKISGYIPK